MGIGSTSTAGVFMAAPIIMFLIYLVMAGLGIYGFILFIRLAHRGIKALDLYIEEKTKRRL